MLRGIVGETGLPMLKLVRYAQRISVALALLIVPVLVAWGLPPTTATLPLNGKPVDLMETGRLFQRGEATFPTSAHEIPRLVGQIAPQGLAQDHAPLRRSASRQTRALQQQDALKTDHFRRAHIPCQNAR